MHCGCGPAAGAAEVLSKGCSPGGDWQARRGPASCADLTHAPAPVARAPQVLLSAAGLVRDNTAPFERPLSLASKGGRDPFAGLVSSPKAAGAGAVSVIRLEQSERPSMTTRGAGPMITITLFMGLTASKTFA